MLFATINSMGIRKNLPDLFTQSLHNTKWKAAFKVEVGLFTYWAPVQFPRQHIYPSLVNSLNMNIHEHELNERTCFPENSNIQGKAKKNTVPCYLFYKIFADKKISFAHVTIFRLLFDVVISLEVYVYKVVLQFRNRSVRVCRQDASRSFISVPTLKQFILSQVMCMKKQHTLGQPLLHTF